MTFESSTLRQTQSFAARVASRAFPGLVIGLDGPLGAGKTQFAKDFAKALGITEPITSPTFSLVNEYEGRLKLFHMDLYRLNDADEFEDFGGLEYFDQGGICLIEWSQRIESLLPHESWRILIELQNNLRLFHLTGASL